MTEPNVNVFAETTESVPAADAEPGRAVADAEPQAPLFYCPICKEIWEVIGPGVPRCCGYRPGDL